MPPYVFCLQSSHAGCKSRRSCSTRCTTPPLPARTATPVPTSQSPLWCAASENGHLCSALPLFLALSRSAILRRLDTHCHSPRAPLSLVTHIVSLRALLYRLVTHISLPTHSSVALSHIFPSAHASVTSTPTRPRSAHSSSSPSHTPSAQPPSPLPSPHHTAGGGHGEGHGQGQNLRRTRRLCGRVLQPVSDPPRRAPSVHDSHVEVYVSSENRTSSVSPSSTSHLPTTQEISTATGDTNTAGGSNRDLYLVVYVVRKGVMEQVKAKAKKGAPDQVRG